MKFSLGSHVGEKKKRHIFPRRAWGFPIFLGGTLAASWTPLVVPLPSDQRPHLWHMHEAQILLWVGPITTTAQKTAPSPSGGPPCPGELDGKRCMNWLKFGSLYTWWDATKTGQHVLHWHMWPCRGLRPTCMCVKQNHTHYNIMDLEATNVRCPKRYAWWWHLLHGKIWVSPSQVGDQPPRIYKMDDHGESLVLWHEDHYSINC